MANSRPTAQIVVESRHGSTLGIAGAIAQRLAIHGYRVTVGEPSSGLDLDADVVVIGSAVYRGTWLKTARRFVEDHAAELADMPVWLFSSGPLAAAPAQGDGADQHDIQCLIDRVQARGHRTFAGRHDRASLGPVEAVVARAVHAPVGDFREWSDINGWADEIVSRMTPNLAHPVRST